MIVWQYREIPFISSIFVAIIIMYNSIVCIIFINYVSEITLNVLLQIDIRRKNIAGNTNKK